MNTRTVRVRLMDPDDLFFEDMLMEVSLGTESCDLDVRRQIAEKIERDSRYYLYEEDSIFAVPHQLFDYRATVLELRSYIDRCPHCGDQSEETRAVAVLASDEGKWGQCPRCDRVFKIARM